MNEVQEMQTKLRLNIETKLRKSQEKDETRIRELQEEIAELQRTHSELDDLSQNDDHLQLLQVSTSPPPFGQKVVHVVYVLKELV